MGTNNLAGVTALTNSNYVVSSGNWKNSANETVGAVTWGSGTTGIVGAVSLTNSLTGTANDFVGSYGVTALANSNYVVSSPYWNNGAATWGNGSIATSGVVSPSNSLVGTKPLDYISVSGITALTNGNYVVSSAFWDNAAIEDAGAVTFGNGTNGIVGAVSNSNSLVGSAAENQIVGKAAENKVIYHYCFVMQFC